MSVFVRVVGEGHAVESATFRFAFGLATIGLIALCRPIQLRPVNRRWLVFRGCVGGSAVYCLYHSIGHLGLAQGSILFFSYPVFTALFAAAVLKERQTLGGWMAVLVAFAGVYLIVWPQDWSGAVVHKLIAVAGAMFAGAAICTVRKCRRTDSSYTIFASLCMFGLLIMGIRATSEGFTTQFPAAAWAALVGVGLFGTLGQLMMTFAYKTVQASSGSIYSFVTPVVNVLIGAARFDESLSTRAWLGAGLVIGACLYVSWPKRAQTEVEANCGV